MDESLTHFNAPLECPPLGIQQPLMPHQALGQSVPSLQFLRPLGAQPLAVLDPGIFSAQSIDPIQPFSDFPFFEPPSQFIPSPESPTQPEARSLQRRLDSDRPMPTSPSSLDPAIQTKSIESPSFQQKIIPEISGDDRENSTPSVEESISSELPVIQEKTDLAVDVSDFRNSSSPIEASIASELPSIQEKAISETVASDCAINTHLPIQPESLASPILQKKPISDVSESDRDVFVSNQEEVIPSERLESSVIQEQPILQRHEGDRPDHFSQPAIEIASTQTKSTFVDSNSVDLATSSVLREVSSSDQVVQQKNNAPIDHSSELSSAIAPSSIESVSSFTSDSDSTPEREITAFTSASPIEAASQVSDHAAASVQRSPDNANSEIIPLPETIQPFSNEEQLLEQGRSDHSAIETSAVENSSLAEVSSASAIAPPISSEPSIQPVQLDPVTPENSSDLLTTESAQQRDLFALTNAVINPAGPISENKPDTTQPAAASTIQPQLAASSEIATSSTSDHPDNSQPNFLSDRSENLAIQSDSIKLENDIQTKVVDSPVTQTHLDSFDTPSISKVATDSESLASHSFDNHIENESENKTEAEIELSSVHDSPIQASSEIASRGAELEISQSQILRDRAKTQPPSSDHFPLQTRSDSLETPAHFEAEVVSHALNDRPEVPSLPSDHSLLQAHSESLETASASIESEVVQSHILGDRPEIPSASIDHSTNSVRSGSTETSSLNIDSENLSSNVLGNLDSIETSSIVSPIKAKFTHPQSSSAVVNSETISPQIQSDRAHSESSPIDTSIIQAKSEPLYTLPNGVDSEIALPNSENDRIGIEPAQIDDSMIQAKSDTLESVPNSIDSENDSLRSLSDRSEIKPTQLDNSMIQAKSEIAGLSPVLNSESVLSNSVRDRIDPDPPQIDNSAIQTQSEALEIVPNSIESENETLSSLSDRETQSAHISHSTLQAKLETSQSIIDPATFTNSGSDRGEFESTQISDSTTQALSETSGISPVLNIDHSTIQARSEISPTVIDPETEIAAPTQSTLSNRAVQLERKTPSGVANLLPEIAPQSESSNLSVAQNHDLVISRETSADSLNQFSETSQPTPIESNLKDSLVVNQASSLPTIQQKITPQADLPEIPTVLQPLGTLKPLSTMQSLLPSSAIAPHPIQRQVEPSLPVEQRESQRDRAPESSFGTIPDRWNSISDLFQAVTTSESPGRGTSLSTESEPYPSLFQSSTLQRSSDSDAYSNLFQSSTVQRTTESDPYSNVQASTVQRSSESEPYPSLFESPIIQRREISENLADIQRDEAPRSSMPSEVPPSNVANAADPANPSPTGAQVSADQIDQLARVIYQQVRQRLAIERERQGNHYSGRIQW